jgi:hypothetical protein
VSERYPGGIITKSTTTPTGPYQSGTAPGIWTLDQQLQFQQQGIWPTAGLLPNYIEDVFSTYLYTGNGTGQTITNGIDLSNKGGLVWIKDRSGSTRHVLTDTARGVSTDLFTDNTAAQSGPWAGNDVTAFNSNGFSLGTNFWSVNTNADLYASWTFRKQAKFFDVVTYTGNGTTNQTINHNLGSTPGFIITKRTDSTGNWTVWHTSFADTKTYAYLNTTAAATTVPSATAMTVNSTYFTVGSNQIFGNGSGWTYVAYLFASNAGGFGSAGTDNVITCGSFTTDGSGNATVNLGYEPQFWLYKPVGTGGWTIYDTMRGWSQTSIFNLNPNTSGAEGGGSTTAFYPTATGFDCVGSNLNPSATYIYIAIRRGPMATPTDATKVLQIDTGTNNSNGGIVPTNFAVDASILSYRTVGLNGLFNDRLRGYGLTNSAGVTPAMQTSGGDGTQGESNWAGSNPFFYNATNSSITRGSNGTNAGGIVTYFLKRAPGFFDEVCYTGTGSATTQTHNLGVAPEMLIIKKRSGVGSWGVLANTTGLSGTVGLLDDAGPFDTGFYSGYFNSTLPTSSVFSVGANTTTNGSGSTYVAYLFATVSGVSKVGTYTGNGSTQTINCGFGAGGVRFVLIKRTDSSSGWYVYDTGRGMTTVTDPYFLMNTTAAEVATLGSVTTVSTGFALNSSILAAINVNAGTYIFLAIA